MANVSRRAAAKVEDLTAAAEDTLAVIGTRVRELRIAKRLTLEELGRRTSLSPSMLSLVERGKTMPWIGSLVVICCAPDPHGAELLSPVETKSRDPVSRASKQPIFETAKGVLRRVLREHRGLGIEIA